MDSKDHDGAETGAAVTDPSDDPGDATTPETRTETTTAVPDAPDAPDAPEHARELARSLVRVTVVNVTLALLVAVTNWAAYPAWACGGVVISAVAAVAVGLVLRRRALATPADADARTLNRLGRHLLATLLATHLPLMAFAAAGVLSS